MADRSALTRLGLNFGALTIAVTLIGAAVVKQYIDNRPTIDLAGLSAVEAAVTR